jgi:NADH-quinone oxidoreductase subunit E
VNKLLETYPQEVVRILAKYPEDRKRSAVMPLLYLAQRKAGYLTRQSISEIAEIVEVTPTEVASIAGFYTLYHEESRSPNGSSPNGGPRYRLQVCTDLPCALRGAEEFMAALCQNLALKVGETSADGLLMIESVTCLAGCDKAPMLQLQGDGDIVYHENLTVESTLKLVDGLRRNVSAGEAGNGIKA